MLAVVPRSIRMQRVLLMEERKNGPKPLLTVQEKNDLEYLQERRISRFVCRSFSQSSACNHWKLYSWCAAGFIYIHNLCKTSNSCYDVTWVLVAGVFLGFSHCTHCLGLLLVTFRLLLELGHVDLTRLEDSSPCWGHARPFDLTLCLTEPDLEHVVWAEGAQKVWSRYRAVLMQ